MSLPLPKGEGRPVRRLVRRSLGEDGSLGEGGGEGERNVLPPWRVPIVFVLAIVIVLPLCLHAAGPALTGDALPTKDGNLIIHPINHATLALGWKNGVVYADPVGSAERFAGLPKPDIIVITHVHGDHFSVPTLQAVVTEKTAIVAPPSVAAEMPADLQKKTLVVTNSQTVVPAGTGITIEAVAMYNTTPARAQFHPKGKGNGYVITLGDTRVYISGDTEDIPEMRALKNIDVAFICMNLPYTMNEEQAADAVRAFRPKIVYPYHYRGSDLEKFKKLVGTDSGVEVRIRDWYK